MSKLYLIQGLPASGKSTYVTRMMEIRLAKAGMYNLRVVSSDEIRFMCIPEDMYHESEVGDGGYSHLVNHCVWQTVKTDIHKFLDQEYDTVLDATNLHKFFWDDYIRIAKQYGSKVVGVQVNSDLEECIERDSLRLREVGEAVIRKMYAKMEKFTDHRDDFDQIITINYPKNIKGQDD